MRLRCSRRSNGQLRLTLYMSRRMISNLFLRRHRRRRQVRWAGFLFRLVVGY